MRRVVVVGLGSPFGGDRLGWEVLARLQGARHAERLPAPEVALRSCDRPGARLLDEIAGTELAVIVDAVRSGLPAGQLVRLTGAAGAGATHCLSSHGFGVAQTLALGHALNTLPPNIVIHGVELGDNAGVMPDAATLDRLADAVLAEVEAFRAAERGSVPPG